MSAGVQLQTAIFQALSTISEPVYAMGSVPDNVTDRYVVLGEKTLNEWDTDGLTGFDVTMTIHTWDTSATNRSFVALENLQQSIYNLLHRATLITSGYNVIGVEQEMCETMLDPDGLTRHGVQRFRAKMRAL